MLLMHLWLVAAALGAVTVVLPVAASSVAGTAVAAAAPPPPPPPFPGLPMPAKFIPAGIQPPVAHGRRSVHGWLFLPYDLPSPESSASSAASLKGYFYHHTPEFWVQSPHDFEIMVQGQLALEQQVRGLPLPPAAELLGTEYVFTPPEFSLDELISGEVSTYHGHFTNGSFDTPQRDFLSNGTFTISKRTTVHYLYPLQNDTLPQLAYLSYPRQQASSPSPLSSAGTSATVSASVEGGGSASTQFVHLYFLHLLWSAPSFDQIVHVRLDLNSCLWQNGDSAKDVMAVGATFVVEGLPNVVSHRLSPDGSPEQGAVKVQLFTPRSRAAGGGAAAAAHTQCKATVLEEVHCVTMPDSFSKCPPV